MAETFDQVRRRLQTALKPLGLQCDGGRYDAQAFGNWVIQIRLGGFFRRWHGRVVNDRGQILVDIYPEAPADARRVLGKLPDGSSNLDEFIQVLGTSGSS